MITNIKTKKNQMRFFFNETLTVLNTFYKSQKHEPINLGKPIL